MTGRGWALTAGAIVIFAAGEWLGWPALRAAAVLVAAAVGLGVATAARPLRLTVAREFDRTRVHRGRHVEARLTVGNPGRRRHPALAAHDGVPITVPPLPAGGSAVVAYRLPAARRGLLTVGPLRVDRTDPLGVTSRRRSTGGTGTIRVYPAVHPVGTLPGTTGRPADRDLGPAVGLSGAAHLRALRPYVSGDEPRRIHWKATASTGTLMVRDLRDPAEPGIEVVLDDTAGVLTPDRFEQAVDLAASLLVAAATAGSPARLRTATGLDVDPRPGPEQAGILLDALCTVRQGPGRLPRTAGRGTVVLITGLTAASDLGWFAGPGHRVLVDLRAERPAPRIARVRVVVGTDAAALAAGWGAVPAGAGR